MSRVSGGTLWVIAFFTAAIVLAYGTWNMLAGGSLGPTHSYTAVFADASGLAAGNEARIAGVPIGRVQDVDLDRSGHAVVHFDLDRDVVLTATSRAAIRYKDLTGGRYISLFQPADEPIGRSLTAGAAIPLGRTQPALDLDQLFGSFQPLLQGLSPEQVNRLSTEFIQVLQGEGGTMLALLQDIATFTASIADRDDLIGKVIDGLSAGIASIDDGRGTLAAALHQTQTLVSALNDDRKILADGLHDADRLAVQATDLLTALRPSLMDTSAELERATKLINKPANTAGIGKTLDILPDAYLRMSGAGSYGTFYNFYLCGLGLVADGVQIPIQKLGEPRCK